MRSKISAILRTIGVVAMAVMLAGATALMPSPAYAYGHGGHHGGGWGWGWGLGLGLGLGAAAAWSWPGYYYPYEPYPYYVPAVPATTIIQQTPAVAPAPAAAPSWYYCNKPKGYYPYVSACPGGWRQVAATPPGAPQQ